MRQTRLESLIEVAGGSAVGAVGSWALSYLAAELCEDPATTATVAVGLCTVWSVARGIAVRRLAEALLAKKAHRALERAATCPMCKSPVREEAESVAYLKAIRPVSSKLNSARSGEAQKDFARGGRVDNRDSDSDDQD